MKANDDVRKSAAEYGIPLWKIAYKMGITDFTFSRRLRVELGPEAKAEVMAAIEELRKENKA